MGYLGYLSVRTLKGCVLNLFLIWFYYFLIGRYQSTAGGDLSMLFPLHAGFEPTLPRWLSAEKYWALIKTRAAAVMSR